MSSIVISKSPTTSTLESDDEKSSSSTKIIFEFIGTQAIDIVESFSSCPSNLTLGTESNDEERPSSSSVLLEFAHTFTLLVARKVSSSSLIFKDANAELTTTPEETRISEPTVLFNKALLLT